MRQDAWLVVQTVPIPCLANAIGAPVPMWRSGDMAAPAVHLFLDEGEAIKIAANRNDMAKEDDSSECWVVRPVTVVFLKAVGLSNRKLPNEERYRKKADR